MWRFLRQLRSKPEDDRKRVVFILSTSLILIIFIFWMISFVSLQLEPLGKPDLVNDNIQNEIKGSPLKEIKGLVNKMVEVVKNGFTEVSNSLNNFNNSGSVIESNPVEILPPKEILPIEEEKVQPTEPNKIKNLGEIYFE